MRTGPGALDAIDRATQRGQGGDHTSQESKVNNVNLAEAPKGNSNTYALRRLRKDRPDLHERAFRSARNTPPQPTLVTRDNA